MSVEDAISSRRLIPYYRSILEDPSLADDAIHLTSEGGEPLDLLIPVGGKRKGGYSEVSIAEERAREIAAQMRNRPGFPNARADGCNIVWGEDTPGTGTDMREEIIIARGRHFGYREDAIRYFVRESKRPGGIPRMVRRFAVLSESHIETSIADVLRRAKAK